MIDDLERKIELDAMQLREMRQEETERFVELKQ